MSPTFGERLRQERERLDFTQAAFGQLGGVSRLAQWKYEHDEHVPSVEYLVKLKEAKVDAIYLLTGHRLTVTGVDWDILREAFLLVHRMLTERPGKHYTPEQLFDLFQHLWRTMMEDTYGAAILEKNPPREDIPFSLIK